MVPQEKQVNFRISEDLIKWLRKYSDEENKSMSAVIRELIIKLKREVENG